MAKILLDFYGSWCSPCKAMAPTIESIKDIEVRKIDVEKEPDMAKGYNVRSVPTLIIVEDQKEIDRMMGFTNSKAVLDFVKKHVVS
jgi:thioredoxin 1